MKLLRSIFGGFAVAVFLLAACTSSGDGGGASPGTEAGTSSTSSSSSSGAQPADDSGSQPDGADGSKGPADAGRDAGHILGTLSGSCGVVRTMLTSPSPSLENDALVFVAGEVYDRDALSPDGQRMFDTANAGGSSIESEVMSFEVLRYCEGAKLLKTETEIGYEPPTDAAPNSITDILVEIDGKKVGVSVTRAYKPPSIPLTDADVQSLLVKKLEGVNRSSQRVLPADKWVKQILHVLAVDQNAADAVGRVWAGMDPALKADTIVLVTRTKGGGFIYCNPDPPLGSECP